MKVNEVNGRTGILGVAGFPVAHTLSPVIHNYLFSRYGLNLVYLPFEVSRPDFRRFAKGFPGLANLIGFNVTVPYKEAILPYLDSLSCEARLIGAVNTVRRIRGLWEGCNTDWFGFKKSIEINFPGFRPAGSRVLLVGAGGASRALIYALIKMKIGELVLMDLIHEKALKLARTVSSRHPALKIRAKKMDCGFLKKGVFIPDLIINATYHGLKQNDGPVIDLPPPGNEKPFIYDLIYNPAKTALLRAAEKRGMKHTNGLDMLILQALASFSIWTGIKLDQKLIRHLEPLRALCVRSGR